MLEVYDDLQSTAGQKRLSGQSSRPHRSQSQQKQTMQPIFEQYQKYTNTILRMRKNEDDSENEKIPDKPENDDHDMQAEMITEPDTTAATSTRR